MTDSARAARLSAVGISAIVTVACCLAVAHTEAGRAAARQLDEAQAIAAMLQQPSPPAVGLVPAGAPRRRIVVVRRSRAS